MEILSPSSSPSTPARFFRGLLRLPFASAHMPLGATLSLSGHSSTFFSNSSVPNINISREQPDKSRLDTRASFNPLHFKYIFGVLVARVGRFSIRFCGERCRLSLLDRFLSSRGSSSRCYSLHPPPHTPRASLLCFFWAELFSTGVPLHAGRCTYCLCTTRLFSLPFSLSLSPPHTLRGSYDDCCPLPPSMRPLVPLSISFLFGTFDFETVLSGPELFSPLLVVNNM